MLAMTAMAKRSWLVLVVVIGCGGNKGGADGTGVGGGTAGAAGGTGGSTGGAAGTSAGGTSGTGPGGGGAIGSAGTGGVGGAETGGSGAAGGGRGGAGGVGGGGRGGSGGGGRGGSGGTFGNESCSTVGLSCAPPGFCCAALVCLGNTCVPTPANTDGGGDAPACSGSAGFICVLGSCSNDIGTTAVCTGAGWSCPMGSVDARGCGGCTGHPRPGYVCGDGGWTRVDASGN